MLLTIKWKSWPQFLMRVLLLMLLTSCAKENNSIISNGNGNNGGDNNPVFKHIAFSVTCFFNSSEPKRPHVVTVMIFDQSTGQRLLSGGSNANGKFCSLAKLDTEKTYRIELYQLPNVDCVMGVFDITYQNNPWFWVDNCTDDPKTAMHIGTCVNPNLQSGCWGDNP